MRRCSILKRSSYRQFTSSPHRQPHPAEPKEFRCERLTFPGAGIGSQRVSSWLVDLLCEQSGQIMEVFRKPPGVRRQTRANGSLLHLSLRSKDSIAERKRQALILTGVHSQPRRLTIFTHINTGERGGDILREFLCSFYWAPMLNVER